MPETLTWSNSRDVLAAVHATYCVTLADSLAQVLEAVHTVDAVGCNEILTLADQISERGFLRFLTAPQTSHHLRWRSRETGETADFLRQSLRAEAAKEGLAVPIAEPTWTALGDTCVHSDGTIQEFARIHYAIPLDFGSPYFGLVLQDSSPTHGQSERLDGAEARVVVEKLDAALGGIERTNPAILEFITTFTKSLSLEKDPASLEVLSSGTRAQYIGASALSNPHTSGVETLADALVHEAIHSLLFMQELKQPWVFNSELHGDIPRVVSPWSGRKLPLRAFLQACFVWYGLVHFWCQALTAGSFDRKRAQGFIATAGSGFLDEPLTEKVSEFESEISGDVLSTIQTLQETVTAAYAPFTR